MYFKCRDVTSKLHSFKSSQSGLGVTKIQNTLSQCLWSDEKSNLWFQTEMEEGNMEDSYGRFKMLDIWKRFEMLDISNRFEIWDLKCILNVEI